jgi:hypothetical protein
VGGVSKHLLDQSIPKSMVFPEENLSKSCKEDEVDRGKTFGHGVHDIQGFVVSHLWVPL